jgi:pyruvate/2-oxoglutarate dehydrogenase complex dihydrolipoamide acyltransferase (E2) component
MCNQVSRILRARARTAQPRAALSTQRPARASLSRPRISSPAGRTESGGRAAGAPAVAVARQRRNPHRRARQPARQVALDDQVAHQRVGARLQRRRQQAEHLRNDAGASTAHEKSAAADAKRTCVRQPDGECWGAEARALARCRRDWRMTPVECRCASRVPLAAPRPRHARRMSRQGSGAARAGAFRQVIG